MLEKVTFSVGSNDIESIIGEQLQIMNELMTSDEMRLGYKTILKTEARRLLINTTLTAEATWNSPPELGRLHGTAGDCAFYKSNQTLVDVSRDFMSKGQRSEDVIQEEASVPLGLFFTKHVSQYFPCGCCAATTFASPSSCAPSTRSSNRRASLESPGPRRG